MPKYIVEGVPKAPAAFGPLTNRDLTDALRGQTVRTRSGHYGQITHGEEVDGEVFVFVRLESATGWFDITTLIFDQEPS